MEFMYIKLFENFELECTEIDSRKFEQYLSNNTQDMSDLDVESLDDILIDKRLIGSNYVVGKGKYNDLITCEVDPNSQMDNSFTIFKAYSSNFLIIVSMPQYAKRTRLVKNKYFICDGFGGLIKIIRQYAN